MALPYNYRIDVSDHGEWRTSTADGGWTFDERDPQDIARALLEDWVVDHPGGMAGGGRIAVDSGDLFEEPLEGDARVRVCVFLGEAQPPDEPVEVDVGGVETAGLPPPMAEPAAVAYLLADPEVEDPRAWVNL